MSTFSSHCGVLCITHMCGDSGLPQLVLERLLMTCPASSIVRGIWLSANEKELNDTAVKPSPLEHVTPSAWIYVVHWRVSTILSGISVEEWVYVCGPGHSTEPSCRICQPHHTTCARRKVNVSALNPTELSMFSVLPDYPKGAIGHIVHTEKGILAVEKNKVLIPPLWSKTFCWGFEDFTCCFGNYGSEKVNKKKIKHSRN